MENNLELLVRAKEGDKDSKDKLVMGNMGLVWSIARRFTGRGCELEDIVSIGTIGLIKAIDRFDMKYEVEFSTYAVPMITGEIKRFFRDSGTIKVSRSLKEIYGKIYAYRDTYIKQKGREPELSEIAEALNIEPEEITMAMEAARPVESFDNPGGMEGKGEDREEKLMDKLLVDELMANLSEEEYRLIELRYFREMSQSDTGRRLGFSQVQVSRYEKKIIEKLRNMV